MLDGRHGFGANDDHNDTPSCSDPSNTTDTPARVGTTRHGRTVGSQ
jgi:hypothetical protein